MLCAGEEELMRVRYVSPFAVSRSNGWDLDCYWSCWVGRLLFVWLFVVVWLVLVCVVVGWFVLLIYGLSHS